MTHSPMHFKRRVLVSNERFDAWPVGLPQQVPGMCVGVGATHLWTLAAGARSDGIFGCDRSESVRMQNELFSRLLATSRDRHECLARWLSRHHGVFDKGLVRETARTLARDNKEELGFIELLWRHGFFGEALCYSGLTLGDHLASPWHPLQSEAAFEHLRAIPARFVASDVRQLHVASASIFYFSNVGDYVQSPALAARLRPLNAYPVVANAIREPQALEVLPWSTFCARLAGSPVRPPGPSALWRAYDESAVLPAALRAELLVSAFEGAPDEARAEHFTDAARLSPGQRLRIARLTGQASLVSRDAPADQLDDWVHFLDRAPPAVIAAAAESPVVEHRVRAASLRPLLDDPELEVRSESALGLLARGEPLSAWDNLALDGARLATTRARSNDELLRHLMEREGISPVHMWPEWLLGWARPLPGLSPGVDEFVTAMTPAERAERLLELDDPVRALACANALALALGYYD